MFIPKRFCTIDGLVYVRFSFDVADVKLVLIDCCHHSGIRSVTQSSDDFFPVHGDI